MTQQGVLKSRATEKPFHIACKRDKMLERYVVGMGGPTQALAKHVETQAWRVASSMLQKRRAIPAAFSFGPNQSAPQAVIATLP